MGIKSILLSLTILLLGVPLFTTVVSAADGYCNSTTVIQMNVQSGNYIYTYWINYPSYQGSTNCLMNSGATGAGVKSLQSSMNNCYGQCLTVDGGYGPLTKMAVKLVQKAVGMAQDGEFGPITGSLMGWWTASINGGPNLCVRPGTSV